MMPMTPEERFERIEENLLRCSERMDRFEAAQEASDRRFSERMERFEAAQEASDHRWRADFQRVMDVMAELARRQQEMQHTQQEMQHSIESLQDQQRLTQAALDKLILNIDRFIQGRGGNGQG